MTPPPPPPPPADPSAGRGRRPAGGPSGGPSAAAFAGVGIQLGLTLTLFALLGRWLDARLGTSPWLLLVCVFVGASAGFYSIYRRVIGGGRGTRPGRPSGGPPAGPSA